MNESQTVQREGREEEICRQNRSSETELAACHDRHKEGQGLTAKNDLTGMTFSDWRVVSRPNPLRAIYLCRCKCGTEKLIDGWHLIHETTKQCNKHIRERNKTHGMKGTPVYKTWDSMKQRCFNQLNDDWKNYGGRGITVCTRWLDSFENFLEDMGERPHKHTLDRIDPNGNYEPNNCRWATMKEQANNRRNNVFVTAFGETKTIMQWIDDPRCQTKYNDVFRWRLKRGWSSEKVITFPIKTIRSKRASERIAKC
jgi:hypothetical protein